MSIRTLKSKPFSEIKNLELSYLDKTVDYISDSYATSEAFDFSLYNAFENFNDFSVNNYSYFFLGKKDLFSNWLKVNNKVNELNGFISPIQFSLDGKPAFMFFDKTSISGTPNLVQIWDAGFTLRTAESLKTIGIDINNISDHQNYLFLVEFIGETNQCYIKHIDGAAEFYLYNRRYNERSSGGLGNSCDDLWMTTNPDLYKKFGVFNYILTKESILFFLSQNDFVQINLGSNATTYVSYQNNLEWISGDDYKVIKPVTVPEKYWYDLPDNIIGRTVQIKDYGMVRSLTPNDKVSQKLSLVENKELKPLVTKDNITYNVVSTIYNNPIDTSDYVNTSWLSYLDNNRANINVSKSAYNLESQCLFHLQYNNIDNKFTSKLNVIPLKNNVSPQNNIIRGNYLQTGTINDPNVDFREYTTIETGSNQEFGNSTVNLTYTFYDLEYFVSPGEDLIISTRENDSSLSGSLVSSMYPFINLNINDTKFIKNGAFGSTIPFLADKFKKLQKNSQFTNNGRYLYTWLYQSTGNRYGIWLDRYYYPNLISKEESLKGKVNFDPASFEDIIDKNYIQKDQTFISYIQDAPYFDKQSDLVIEKNSQYVYSRLGSDNVKTIIDDIEPYKQTEIKEFTSKNSSVQIIDNNNIKNNGVLDLNFDMFLSPDQEYGIDLFSNSPTNGLTIKNRKDISPFLYTFDNLKNDKKEITNTLIRLHNPNFEVIKTIDLKGLYNIDEEIVSLVLGLPFDDICILTTKNFYIVGFDLLIKEKFNIMDIFGPNITILKGYIANNNLYFICFDKVKVYRPIFLLDLAKIKNLKIKELERFTSFSRLGYRINDKAQTELFPLYFYQPSGEVKSEGNLVLSRKDEKGQSIYKTVSNKEYLLPLGINVNEEVYLIDTSAFDLNYWFYAPTFAATNTLVNGHNSLNINSLYIDKNYNIFAFQYSFIANKANDSTLFGIRERATDALYQVENIILEDYKEKLYDDGNSNIIFASYDHIFGITVDTDNRFAILKNQPNKLKGESKLELLLFDKAKRLISTMVLGKTYKTVFGLDTLKTYNKGKVNNYFSLFGIIFNKDTTTNSYHSLLVDSNYQLTDTELNYSIDPKLDKTVNYNNILEENNSNTLDFILNLPKSSLLSDKFTYSFDMSKIIAGWYNFRVLVNLNEGIFEVYVNDILLPVKQSFIIDKYIYNLKNVFNYPFILGSTVYRNGITLDKFLNLEQIMPFETTNIRIQNFILYFKQLEDFERQSLLFSLTNLEPLVITLPGGQKNNIEEIIRYFKYNPPASISNTIRINIKNSGITNLKDQQLLSLDILKKINDELACPLSIQEIKFI